MAYKTDLTGNIYNRLTVIAYSHSTPKNSFWLCKCDCGNEKVINASSFKNGTTKSCGCLSKEREDLTGHKYSRLLVTNLAFKGENGTHYWNCICDCGNTSIISTSRLNNGRVKSCGCYSKELTILRSTIHGDSKRGKKPSEYTCWSSMITRCTNSKNKAYKYYGGRGISVCDEWLNSYKAFLMDMGRKPSPKHSLDRIDVNGNYCKENCKWSSPIEQASNKRTSLHIDVNGEKVNLKRKADELGIKYHTLRWRIKNGWSLEKSFQQ